MKFHENSEPYGRLTSKWNRPSATNTSTPPRAAGSAGSADAPSLVPPPPPAVTRRGEVQPSVSAGESGLGV